MQTSMAIHPLGGSEKCLYILIACRALFWNNVCGVVSHCNQFMLICLGVQVDILALCVAFVFVLLYTFVWFVALRCGGKV